VAKQWIVTRSNDEEDEAESSVEQTKCRNLKITILVKNFHLRCFVLSDAIKFPLQCLAS